MIQQSGPSKVARPAARSWRSIFRGMSRVLEIFPSTPPDRRPIGSGLTFVSPATRLRLPGFSLLDDGQTADVDIAALRADWQSVGRDLRVALASHDMESTTDERK